MPRLYHCRVTFLNGDSSNEWCLTCCVDNCTAGSSVKDYRNEKRGRAVRRLKEKIDNEGWGCQPHILAYFLGW